MVTRGDVFRVYLPATPGHPQAGSRYGIVVQASELAALSTAVIVPTSRSAPPSTFRPEVGLAGERTLVLTEQLQPLDLRNFGDFAGRISLGEMQAVDEALKLVLDLR